MAAGRAEVPPAEPIRIYGLDFTSAPTAATARAARRKDLMLAEGRLAGGVLTIEVLRTLNGRHRGDFGTFEEWLRTPGPWVAGLDFPFGQPRPLIADLGWPADSWAAYVAHARALGKAGFERALLDYAAANPPGRKHLRRRADALSRSISPMMLHYTPVAKMFFEGAPRLLDAPVSIPPVRPRAGATAVVLEAYPRLVVDRWLAGTPYKAEGKEAGRAERRQAREHLVDAIRGRSDDRVAATYGCRVELPAEVEAPCVADDAGDGLDSVLCALQAAWAALRPGGTFGIPPGVDPLEGWISDPALRHAGPPRPDPRRRGGGRGRRG